MTRSFLFLGTPEFAVPTLTALNTTFPSQITRVLTRPDAPKGRGKKLSPSPIKQCATSLGIPVACPTNKSELTDQISADTPDIIIVVAYGMLIPKSITDQYPCINIHPSLLPKYRGPSPIQSALLNQDKITGSTLMLLNEEMDAGNILDQIETPISDADTAGDLHDRLATLSADHLCHYLSSHQPPYQSTPQNHEQATYCKKIEKPDTIINTTDSAQLKVAKIRAFSPYPGATIIQNDKRIKILKARYESDTITPIIVKPEGKAEMSYSDYLLAHPEIHL